MSSNAEPESQTEASGDSSPPLAIHIQEDGERVGVVNIDEESYEYHGVYEDIEQLLHRMATQGFEHRIPVEPPDEWGETTPLPTKRIKRTGEDLAQYLPRLIEQRGRGDPEVYAKPVGYERTDGTGQSIPG